VSSDDLLLQRIRESLSSDAIALLEAARDVFCLSDRAAAANAIVIAVDTGVHERGEVIRAAHARFPGTPIVVIASPRTNGVHKALDAGACGLVRHSQIESALGPAIRAVCTGQVVVPQESRRHAIRPALSHREKQTLALVTAGLSNRQIAARLYLAESTVKTHLSSVFGKLGVDSRSEAAALVLDPDEKLGISILGLPGDDSVTNLRQGG
jgi:DNA-binding NarL/FixJ family response regulator